MFDAMQSAANLDAKAGGLADYQIDDLERANPHLGFVFDLVRHLQDTAEETQAKHDAEFHEYKREVDRLTENVGDLIQRALNLFSSGEDGETMGLERRDAEEIWPMLCHARKLCEDFDE